MEEQLLPIFVLLGLFGTAWFVSATSVDGCLIPVPVFHPGFEHSP